ncbi:hypothetical protein [Nocardioides sp.]|uniref:hypothetical protein n=1 Tax=Nocardioides sp. TaxID=35761 RepID=UPI0039E48A20
MYGDPRAIRRLGGELRAQARRVEEEADRLIAEAAAVEWDGVAATAMRAHVQAQAGGLRRAAAAHRQAADALDRHADRVAYLLKMIARIEHAVMSAIASAKRRITKFLDGLIDSLTPMEEVLRDFVPPPAGDRRWLDVRIPGLSLPVVL